MANWTPERKKEVSKIIMTKLSQGVKLNDILETNNCRGEFPDTGAFQNWMSEDRNLKTQYLELTRYNSNYSN
jgi:hypothetical protein